MIDRTFASLVVSNSALVLSVIALAVALVAARQPVALSAPEETVPPQVSLSASRCAGQTDCWDVSVATASASLPWWRFAVIVFQSNSQILSTPVIPTQNGTLWVSGDPWPIYLNFTDSEGDRNLSVGDFFALDNLAGGGGAIFSVRLLWAENGSQLAMSRFVT